ncbi:transposase [Sagittula sp. M10.9X]|uniref:Transposase n=1 Tax=Sagittula salina TaxID=2820268 RepID=A0A940S211_9RHOB|nr:transposase [Sagittula salina]
MKWFAQHDCRPGRPAAFSDAGIQLRLTFKVWFKLPFKQTSGMAPSIFELPGQNWAVPDHSTLSRRQKTLKVQIPNHRSGGPLKAAGAQWGHLFLRNALPGDRQHRHQVPRRRGMAGAPAWRSGKSLRRKFHLAMDTATSDTRAVGFPPAGTATSQSCGICWNRSRKTKT